jgi:hypothetical protein
VQGGFYCGVDIYLRTWASLNEAGLLALVAQLALLLVVDPFMSQHVFCRSCHMVEQRARLGDRRDEKESRKE